ncbi:MAG: hypothetical protein SchgKO_15520 [Schleiferiaceae bacterium]
MASCDDDDDINITPPPDTSGKISGRINLYDEGTTQLDGSGMVVTVMNTDPIISDTTDSQGHFALENVPLNTHTLIYEKANYGTFKKFNVDLNSGNTPLSFSQSESLGEKTTNSVNTLSANVSSDSIIIHTDTPSGSLANSIYYRAIFSNTQGVSLNQLEGFSATFVSKNTTGNFKISKDELEAFGFSSGQTIYVKSVAESFFSNDYYDPDKAMHVFPNANETGSTELSFTMP